MYDISAETAATAYFAVLSLVAFVGVASAFYFITRNEPEASPVPERLADWSSYQPTHTYTYELKTTTSADKQHLAGSLREVLDFLESRKDKTAKSGLRAVRANEIATRTGLLLRDVHKALDLLVELNFAERVQARRRSTDPKNSPAPVSYRAVSSAS